LSTLCFRGKVYTGKGEGKKFIELPWVQRQIQQKLGFVPYEGTLNIRLNEESLALKRKLDQAEYFEIVPETGYCKGIVIKAKIAGLNCGIIIPLIPNYPSEVLEVVAPVYLRHRLHLTDGNEAAVTLSL
jgi:riboflavin kinase, archaea type